MNQCGFFPDLELIKKRVYRHIILESYMTHLYMRLRTPLIPSGSIASLSRLQLLVLGRQTEYVLLKEKRKKQGFLFDVQPFDVSTDGNALDSCDPMLVGERLTDQSLVLGPDPTFWECPAMRDSSRKRAVCKTRPSLSFTNTYFIKELAKYTAWIAYLNSTKRKNHNILVAQALLKVAKIQSSLEQKGGI